MREQASTQGIPVVILTARADEETKLAALSAGANDFLAKPFSTSELHVRVKNLVEAHHDKQNLAKQKQTLEKTIRNGSRKPKRCSFRRKKMVSFWAA